MNQPATPASPADWLDGQIEIVLERFEVAWQSSSPPDLAAFVEKWAHEVPSQSLAELLAELVKIDLEYRWKRVSAADEWAAPQRLFIEDYETLLPGLQVDEALLVEEFHVRRRWGDHPTTEEFINRFGTRFEDLLRVIEEGLATVAGANASTMPSFSDVLLASNAIATSKRAPAPAPPIDCIHRFLVRRTLGEGAFGTVYLAHDPQLDREIAIKLLKAGESGRPAVAAGLHEARLAARLRHPAIVPVYDVGFHFGRPYIVMAYIEGKSLRDRMREGRLPVAQAAGLVCELAAAMHEAHEIGLLHRDLKPANILLDLHQRPHLTDFGLALTQDQRPSLGREISGTPPYMSPEQTRGETLRLDGRSDLWSLGVILYEMLTGRLPFQGLTVDAIFDEIRTRPCDPLQYGGEQLDDDLCRICCKCLEKDAALRYNTGTELAEDLRKYLHQLSLHSFVLPSGGKTRTNVAPPVPHVRGNLPPLDEALVGRAHDVQTLTSSLCGEKNHPVVILGAAGMGKTRLSLEVAHRCADQFSGGAWWVDVSRANDADTVAQAVLDAFGVPPRSDLPPHQAVASMLEYCDPLLLVLDNFEQVADFAAATMGAWRARAPRVRFLVTSRANLGLAGLHQHELTPLAAPPVDWTSRDVEEGLSFDAIQLFAQRAQDVQPGWVLDESNLAAVAAICRQLEGIPLAIELAAARSNVLDSNQILQKLGQQFLLLKTHRKGVQRRQQTLFGALEWSYGLLSAAERRLLVQASMLPNGFYLELAESAFDTGDTTDSVLDVLQALREKSLLRTVQTRFGMRFTLFEVIREFSRAKVDSELSEADADAFHRATARWLIEYAEAWRARVPTPEGPEALERLALEIDGLLMVQDRCLASGDIESAVTGVLAISDALSSRRNAELRLDRLNRCRDISTPHLRSRWCLAMSQACHAAGRWDEAFSHAEEAERIAQQLSDKSLRLPALLQRAELCRARGKFDEALPLLEHCIEAARLVADWVVCGRALTGYGFVLWQQGRVREALSAYAEAERLASVSGDMATEANVARNRGHLCVRGGEFRNAAQCFARAEQISRLLGDQRGIHQAQTGIASVWLEQGEIAKALEGYRKAEQIARRLGELRGIAVNQGNQGIALAELDQHEAALECYAMAETLNRRFNNDAGAALNLGNRASSLAALERWQEALASLDRALGLHERMKNRSQLAINLADRGQLLMQASPITDLAAARANLESAWHIFQELELQSSCEAWTTSLALAKLLQSSDRSAAGQLLATAAETAQQLEYSLEHGRPRVRRFVCMMLDMQAEHV